MTDILRFDHVDVWAHDERAGRTDLLSDISFSVRENECWALLGRNGAGKSTLLSLAGALRHPSKGAVSVLGGTLGRVDVRELRAIVGNVNAAQRIPDHLTMVEYVLTGATGTVQPLPGRLTRDDVKRATEVIDLLHLSHLAQREIDVCSQGERARARIARALMPEPRLLLLDEAAAALDLPAREELLAALDVLISETPSLAMVVVSHHLEELPSKTTHALLLRTGQIIAAGPAHEVITSANLSRAFDLPLVVGHDAGRWSATLRR